jgi:hypothetical protein
MAKKSLAQLRSEGYNISISADNYHPAEGSLADGNDVDIELSSLDTVTSVEILNDTSGKDLLVSINGGTNFSIAGTESKSITNILIESITLTNSSGTAIDYRVLAWGF